MNFDKIFNEGTKKNKRIMTVILLLLGISITVWGLWRGLNDLDPKYFVLVASLVGLLISGFAISGKLFQDIKGSKKQQDILDTTIVTLDKTRQALETATNNFALSQKIDTTTSYTNELSKLAILNISLLKIQNDKIVELNKEIDKNLSLVQVINETQTKKLEDIKGNVTGGESYLSAIFLNNGDGSYRLIAFIQDNEYESQGIYPLSNLSLNIYVDGHLEDASESKNYNTNEEIRLTTNRNLAGIYRLPTNKDYISFGIKIFSNNKKYVQLITFKKFTDNIWYMHIKQFHDQWGHAIRSDKYWDNYPEKLKHMFPQADIDAKNTFSESGEVRF